MSSNPISSSLAEKKSFRLPEIDTQKDARLQAIKKKHEESLKLSDEFTKSAELYGVCRSYVAIGRVKTAQKIVAQIPSVIFRVLATKCIADGHRASGDLLRARRASDSIIQTSIGREAGQDVDHALQRRRESLEHASKQRRKYT